jgi:hypothetical protein
MSGWEDDGGIRSIDSWRASAEVSICTLAASGCDAESINSTGSLLFPIDPCLRGPLCARLEATRITSAAGRHSQTNPSILYSLLAVAWVAMIGVPVPGGVWR